jgi:hypothetical protein
MVFGKCVESSSEPKPVGCTCALLGDLHWQYKRTFVPCVRVNPLSADCCSFETCPLRPITYVCYP